MKVDAVVKVMQNHTICLPKEIRKAINIAPQDFVVISMKNNVVSLKKAPAWSSLKGQGKQVFKKLGGGENYLKKERTSW